MKYFSKAFNTYRDIDEWRRTIKSQEFKDSYTNVSGFYTLTKPYKFEDYYYRVHNGKVIPSDFPCFLNRSDVLFENNITLVEQAIYPKYKLNIAGNFELEITHMYTDVDLNTVINKYEINIVKLLSKLHSLIQIDREFTIDIKGRYGNLSYDVSRYLHGYNISSSYEDFHVKGGIDELVYILGLDIATRVVYGGQKLRKLWRVFNWFRHNDVITDYMGEKDTEILDKHINRSANAMSKVLEYREFTPNSDNYYFVYNEDGFELQKERDKEILGVMYFTLKCSEEKAMNYLKEHCNSTNKKHRLKALELLKQ